ncbi:ABC transporter substrate-binding protein [Pullulanibacillus sp. KACC 23026]|uniref:ABC transporter substrate-binding protein n=1 Tax=Pullulanibacillus sp. KACC 23026 TaxID=3028315 RepID=UPI0023AF85CE|nr:ABC transporter substrate-binding protein [Pullulanibacillus sp. KACC 23026]WEG14735.1 ABC transporter substrate-binding protein [Pullulanibacillus sp. KACC 23026]
MKSKKLLVFAILALLISSILTGCSKSTTSTSSKSSNNSSTPGAQPMTIATDDGSPTFQENWNPFSVNARKGVAWMYETLYYISSQTGDETPWLATSYKWNSSTDLVYTIRDGVKWNDGQPFTAKDVAFTFNMLKNFPALDSHGLWTTLESVTANGNTVDIKFSKPDTPAFTYINQIPIVPEHIWSKVDDPVQYTNIPADGKTPVATGAFELQKFTPYQYTLVPYKGYWQADKIHESQLIFPALNGADTVDMNLSQGKYDWTQAYVPDVQKTYIDKDPKNNHYWYAQSAASNIVMNLNEKPFNNVKFRQAMEYAIDTKELSAKGENGYDAPADRSGLHLPGQNDYLDQSLEAKYGYNTPSSDKALSLLKSIGYKKNSSGKLIGPDGKQVAFSIEVPTGWTDWITCTKLIKNQLAKIGIDLTVKTPEVAAWSKDLGTGSFDMSFTTGLNLYDPWFYYNLYLNSSNAHSGDKNAAGNYEGWKDPKTDQLLDQYKSVTSDADKKKIIQQLEAIMYEQVPLIPLFYNANWNQYSTKKFVGWPDAKNPYATPTFAMPDVEMIMTHLTLASK